MHIQGELVIVEVNQEWFPTDEKKMAKAVCLIIDELQIKAMKKGENEKFSALSEVANILWENYIRE